MLEELEALVEELDQQEAAKQQAFRRAEAAEKELEAIQAESPQTAVVSALLYLSCWCTLQTIGVGPVSDLLDVCIQPLNGVMSQPAQGDCCMMDSWSVNLSIDALYMQAGRPEG